MAAGAGPDPIHTVVLATRNQHKLREFGRLLAPAGIAVEPLPDDVTLPPEDGDTFIANALPKARTAAAATGRPAIADDSGIESEVLGGRPGVRSARFAGEHATDQQNLDKLLAEAPAGSVLRYVCAVAFVDPRTAEEHAFVGDSLGRLAEVPRGSGGFGYDPAFLPDEYGHERTMAELTDIEKDRVSHRGRALAEFVKWLRGGREPVR